MPRLKPGIMICVFISHKLPKVRLVKLKKKYTYKVTLLLNKHVFCSPCLNYWCKKNVCRFNCAGLECNM